MNADKWISQDKRSKKLVIRFKVKNFPKQFYIASGLTDTTKNRSIVRERRDLIERDIALGRFDPSLASYQFRTANTQAPILEQQPTLGELWSVFKNYKIAFLEQTTILNSYEVTARFISRLPSQELKDAVKIRDWLLANTTYGMAWRLISRFSDCCNWAIASALISVNPFEKLKLKRPKKKSDADDYRAYTKEQRDLIIAAFEGHSKFSHYAPLIKFLFWTGCRHGEAFALTWGDIQENATRISFTKSCNAYRIKKGTKNGKRRTFPTTSGSKLQELLLAMKPPAGEYTTGSLVFTSKTGRPLTSALFRSVWRGCRVGGRFYPGIVTELASLGEVPYIKPYSTRHTFATWAIASGVTPDRVALWIGDEVNTVLQYYCHPNIVSDECPDF